MKFEFALILSLVFLLGSAFSCKVSRADSTIVYIRADGSIDPTISPISTLDNVTYTLTDNTNSSVFIERDNITFNGNGHSILGQAFIFYGNGNVGLYCVNRANITVSNTTIASGTYAGYCSGSVFSGNNMTDGFTMSYSNNNTLSANRIGGTAYRMVSMSLDHCNNNNFSGNYVTDNGLGLYASFYNTISENNIAHALQGIYLSTSGSNVIVDNNVTDIATTFIGLSDSHGNIIYHNNFINGGGVSLTDSGPPHGSGNTWDNGFEGNYWSDYNGTDDNQDGIADTAYVIDADNTDHYPLTGTFQTFNFSSFYYPVERFEEVDIISNSTIGNVDRWYVDDVHSPTGGDWYLSLTGVAGQEGTTGFCRITFPNIMMNSSSYPIYLGNEFTTPQISSRIIMLNGTHTTLYFTYVHPVPYSTIDVFPEFPSFLILPLFFIVTLFGVIIYRKRLARS